MHSPFAPEPSTWWRVRVGAWRQAGMVAAGSIAASRGLDTSSARPYGPWWDDLQAFFGGRSDEQIAALVEELVHAELGQRVVGASWRVPLAELAGISAGAS